MLALLLAAALAADAEARTVTAPDTEVRVQRSRTSKVVGRLDAGFEVVASACRERSCRVRYELRGTERTGFVDEAALSASKKWAPRDPKPGERGRLMRVGMEHHGEEVVVRDGDPMLALCQDALVATHARLEPVEDAVVDAPGRKTGRVLQTPECERAQWAVAVAGLRPGPMITAGVNGGSVREGASVRLNLRTHRLTVRERGEELDLLLNGTTFASVQKTEDAILGLAWAGDLDGDGELDFIVDLATGGNESIPTLFLSTAGAAGKPAPVAAHHTTGC
jgi:hypothetical protein